AASPCSPRTPWPPRAPRQAAGEPRSEGLHPARTAVWCSRAQLLLAGLDGVGPLSRDLARRVRSPAPRLRRAPVAPDDIVGLTRTEQPTPRGRCTAERGDAMGIDGSTWRARPPGRRRAATRPRAVAGA